MRSARRGRKGDGANFDRTQIGARRERIESRGGARREPKRGSRFGGSSTRGSARVLTRATCLRLPRRGLDPPSAAPRPAPRTFERGRRRKYFKKNREDSSRVPTRKKDVRGAPACRVTSRRVAEANTRRRDAGASRRQLRDERRAVLRVHGGRLLRHKRSAAGARSGPAWMRVFPALFECPHAR